MKSLITKRYTIVIQQKQLNRSPATPGSLKLIKTLCSVTDITHKKWPVRKFKKPSMFCQNNRARLGAIKTNHSNLLTFLWNSLGISFG